MKISIFQILHSFSNSTNTPKMVVFTVIVSSYSHLSSIHGNLASLFHRYCRGQTHHISFAVHALRGAAATTLHTGKHFFPSRILFHWSFSPVSSSSSAYSLSRMFPRTQCRAACSPSWHTLTGSAHPFLWFQSPLQWENPQLWLWFSSWDHSHVGKSLLNICAQTPEALQAEDIQIWGLHHDPISPFLF